ILTAVQRSAKDGESEPNTSTNESRLYCFVVTTLKFVLGTLKSVLAILKWFVFATLNFVFATLKFVFATLKWFVFAPLKFVLATLKFVLATLKFVFAAIKWFVFAPLKFVLATLKFVLATLKFIFATLKWFAFIPLKLVLAIYGDQHKEDNNNMRNEIKELRQENSKMHNKNQQLRQEKNQLDNENQQFRQEKGQLENENQQLRQEKNQLDNENQQLRQDKNQLDNENQQLRQDKNQLDNENQQFQQEKGQLQNENQQLEQEKSQLENENQSLRQDKNQLEIENQQLEQEKSQLENENQQLRQKTDDIINEMQETRQENNNMEIEIQQYREDTMSSIFSESGSVVISNEELGRGAWGAVYTGDFYGTKVAVKEYYEIILSPHNLQILQREINIASQCRHPNLLQFICATKNHQNRLLIVTELMDMALRTLVEQRATERSQLEDQKVESISLDVARGLNYLHSKTPNRIIHRDVSSANVLLWIENGAVRRAKISDYGSANFMEVSKTANPGSALYAAPEANREKQDPKIDVFSYGFLVCEMSVCELPHPEQIKRKGQIKDSECWYQKIGGTLYGNRTAKKANNAGCNWILVKLKQDLTIPVLTLHQYSSLVSLLTFIP
ncbi:probable serine threonine- kinase DDB_G0271682, partial [Paramuricea clavata]